MQKQNFEIKKPSTTIMAAIIFLAILIVSAMFVAYEHQYNKKENNFILNGYKTKETKYNDLAQTIELEFNGEAFNK